jgi:hypothetical protein
MRRLGLRGVVRGKSSIRTTIDDEARDRARSGRSPVPRPRTESPVGGRPDVHQDPQRLGLRRLRRGCVLALRSRLAGVAIAADRPRTRCPGDGALGAPRHAPGRPHPPQRPGVRYLAIRYTERLAEVGAAPSVGSRGDSYDNALAESFNGHYKTEPIVTPVPGGGLMTSRTPPLSMSIGSITAVYTGSSA